VEQENGRTPEGTEKGGDRGKGRGQRVKTGKGQGVVWHRPKASEQRGPGSSSEGSIRKTRVRVLRQLGGIEILPDGATHNWKRRRHGWDLPSRPDYSKIVRVKGIGARSRGFNPEIRVETIPSAEYAASAVDGTPSLVEATERWTCPPGRDKPVALPHSHCRL
jgi:hypothetical protein